MKQKSLSQKQIELYLHFTKNINKMKSLQYKVLRPQDHQEDRGPFISLAEANDFAKHQYGKWFSSKGKLYNSKSKTLKADLEKYMKDVVKLITV